MTPFVPAISYEEWVSKTEDAQIMGGTPCIPGTLLTCDTVARRVLRGDVEDLLDAYPDLTHTDLVYALRLDAQTEHRDRPESRMTPQGRLAALKDAIRTAHLPAADAAVFLEDLSRYPGYQAQALDIYGGTDGPAWASLRLSGPNQTRIRLSFGLDHTLVLVSQTESHRRGRRGLDAPLPAERWTAVEALVAAVSSPPEAA